MAEVVHLRLEHGFQELEEMKRIGLFKKEEVRKIASKRSHFEYKLRRRNKKKEDFLHYIEFEICLLMLISKRRERLVVDSKKKEIDNSIAKKINRLFKAAISRYPEDEKLWLNQIEYFKRMKWHDSINALYAKILQVHGNKPDLWVQAAKWEMENNNSFDNARLIFQRGVLMHRKSEILWHEYFRMELQYIEMIKKRREVLQLHNMKDDSSANDAVMNGEVVNVVYAEAVKEISDIDFSLSFLQICLEFKASRNSDLILCDIQERFPDCEETLDALAKRPLLHTQEREEEGKQAGLKANAIYRKIYDEINSNYEKAVKTLPTEKMWNFYLNFLFESLNCCEKEKRKDKMETIILDKLEQAAKAHSLSEENWLIWIDLLEKKGKHEALLSVAMDGVTKKFSSSLEFWLKYLHLKAKYEESEITEELITKAILFVGAKKGSRSTLPIWKFAIDWFSINKPSAKKNIFEIGLGSSDDHSCSIVKEMYLESTALQEGLQGARDLYKRFKNSGKLTLQLVKVMIKIEQSQLTTPVTIIRKYYEDAVNLFGGDKIDVWLDYINFEAKYGKDPEKISMIQWRGKKTLSPELVDEFQYNIGQFLIED